MSLLFAFHAIGYGWLSRFNAERFFSTGQTYWNPLTILDAWVPFIPDAVWVYYLYLPTIIIYFLALPSVREFLAFAALYVIGTVLAFVCFYLMPVAIPLQPVECVRLACDVVNHLREFDAPVNVMPSLHAFHGTLVMLTALIWFQGRIKNAFAVLAFLIVLSALLTKQHAVVDILAGSGLAVVLWRGFLVVNRYPAFVLQSKRSVHGSA